MKCIDCITGNNFGGRIIHDAVVVFDGKSICKHHLLRDYYVQEPTPEGHETMERVESQL